MKPSKALTIKKHEVQLRVYMGILLLPILMTGCYKHKACFKKDLQQGNIIAVLGNCRFPGEANAELSYKNECFVYCTERSYTKDVSKGKICDYGPIDFKQYALIYARITTDLNAYTYRIVTIDTINKTIDYLIVYTSTDIRFRFYGMQKIDEENVVLKIPKVDSTYTLTFNSREEICH